MNLRSLGYRTDLIFPRFEGLVRERDGYWTIETPSNPTFHWGNFLLFRELPDFGDLARWEAAFAREFAHAPGVRHRAFGWDSLSGERGAASEFLAAGYHFNESVVLAAETVRPPARPWLGLEVRPLRTDAEWATATVIQIETRESVYAYEEYRIFKEAQMKRYRAMSDAGWGAWFGGFVGQTQVANLGIFRDPVRELSLGRFQNVVTDPEHRRRGACATLVAEASRWAQKRWGVKTLVLVAEEAGDARRVYESLGYALREKQIGLSKV